MAPTDDFLDYLGNPTPFHAVAATKDRLLAAKFSELDPKESWGKLSPGGYFVTHCETTIVAFIVPSKKATHFRLVGAHTDSPNLRLKPKPSYSKEGYAQFGVEVYGGALLNSWLDRDLGLAGRVLLAGKDGGKGEGTSRLFKIDRPIARVPQLAIHLDRDVNERGVILNKQEHLAPVLGRAVPKDFSERSLIAKELKVKEKDILAIDAMFYSLEKPTIGGAAGEFIFSARLDNLAMCHAGLVALLAAAAEKKSDSTAIPFLALFDHEEVGSESAAGAASAFLPRTLERIVLALGGDKETEHKMFARSHIVSADMAHAVHPNYPERHEARHRPHLNQGPVIKVNAQQRYATTGATRALIERYAEAAKIPIQLYAHRTDLPCGSTIGPITSAKLGIPTVDVGNPMLSMHSAREMCGVEDGPKMTELLRRFLVG